MKPNSNERVITIDNALLDEQATQYFLEMGGLKREGDKFDRMRERGFEIRNQIISNICVTAILATAMPQSFSRSRFTVNDVEFICEAFEDLDVSKMKEVQVYILTAGKLELDDEPIMNQLYADLWGTAYVDAGREYIRDMLLDEYRERHTEFENVIISDSFGPGYYGMEIEEMQNFFRALPADKIDVQIKTSNLILPLKSCAGLYVIADESIQFPSIDCMACYGTTTGCQFCNATVRKLKKCSKIGSNF